MRNHRGVKQESFQFIDLFAGAGGFSVGFEFASFQLIAALEKDPWACDTLKANHSKAQIINEDIRSFKDLFDFRTESPSAIIGGPPCQGFSVAGPAKDPNDPRNTLFMNFAEWVDHLEPEVFVMENVKGILTKRNTSGELIIDIIQNTFREIGYAVEVWKLNAVNFGVPQYRERIFIVGNKNGDTIGLPKITHSANPDDKLFPLVTVEDAILDLPYLLSGEGLACQDYDQPAQNSYQELMRSNSTSVFNHEAMKHTKRLVERYKSIQGGLAIDNLSDELKIRQRNGNGKFSESVYNSNYRHLKKDYPSYTIPASFYSSFIHPTIPRNITAREAARIQSFPDSHIFEGKRTLISKKLLKKQGKDYYNYLSQYNQIGNAVPPLLAKAIADHIGKYLERVKYSSRSIKKVELA